MTTSAIVKHSRAQLKSLESHADSTIRAAHQQMLATLNPHLQVLYQEIQAEQKRRKEADEDEKIPLSFLHENDRLSLVKSLVSGHVEHFAQQSQATVAHLQAQGKALGQAAGREQVQAVKERK